MDIQTILQDHLKRLETLTSDEADEIRAAQSAAAVRFGAGHARDFAAGRRALVAGGHGAEMKVVDDAIRTTRPDLPSDIRLTIRWAVLADAFREELTSDQFEALTLAWPASKPAVAA